MRHPPQQRLPNWTPARPDDPTLASDTTETLPPSYQPDPGQSPDFAPHGKAPRWPLPGKTSRRPHSNRHARVAYAGRGAAHAPLPAQQSAYAPRAAAPRDRRIADVMRRFAPHFHPIHLVLLAGAIAMWLAISLPWGSDAGGNPIFIQQFSIPRISDPSVHIGQLALQTATGIAQGAVILAVALLAIHLIYVLLRRLKLGVLAAILCIPLFALAALLLLADLTLAAGFGGLGFLSQLPFVRDHGFASIGVAQAAFGFYLWWIGIGATLIGALGEMFIDRH